MTPALISWAPVASLVYTPAGLILKMCPGVIGELAWLYVVPYRFPSLPSNRFDAGVPSNKKGGEKDCWKIFSVVRAPAASITNTVPIVDSVKLSAPLTVVP